jgi:predicted Zn-dependent peptidase
MTSASASSSRSGVSLESLVTLRRTVLPSGVRVVSERVPSARSLAIGFWIDTGSRDETPEQNGICHLIEHAVFKGTRRRKTHHIAQYIEGVGGYLNAFTGKDATCYYARVRDNHLARAVTLLADLVRHPAFPEREVLKEQEVILEEMRSIEDDPEDVINDHLERQLFGAHPLGQPVIGTPRTVSGLSADDLHRFVRERYTATNLVVAASGHVEHDHLVRLCERALDGIPAGTPQRRRRPHPRKPSALTLERPVQQTHLVLGSVVAGLRSDGSYALAVLNAVAGDGMSSRLFQRIRERHAYAYNVYSFLAQYEDAGVFGVYAGAEDGKMRKCIAVIEEELDQLCAKAVSARELSRAREQVIGTLLLGLESMSTRMTRLGKDELLFGRQIPLDDIIADISAVTAEDVRAAAARACASGALSRTLIVPKN